jgi:sulfite exporter TauE/SafE/copper chaperone CopZ
MKTYTFHVHGIHCAACSILIESILEEIVDIQKVTVSKSNHTVTVAGEFGELSEADIAAQYSALIEPHGYTIRLEKAVIKKQWSEFLIAVPVTFIFFGAFLLLQKMGLVNLVGGGQVTYGTAFVVGIIASLSTCMAMVGGLVLSLGATFAKRGERVRPQILFHIGRVGGFFIFGGVIGSLGSSFHMSGLVTLILGIVVAVVMFILGLNLLDVFPQAKRLQLSLPASVGKRAHNITSYTHTLTPFLVGIATFFLPCGFTQSMQLYALSTGNFMMGALTMLAFSLGTLPVLGLMSFSSFSIQNARQSGIFFKSAGLIVIVFAFFNLANALVAYGVIAPLFNF